MLPLVITTPALARIPKIREIGLHVGRETPQGTLVLDKVSIQILSHV